MVRNSTNVRNSSWNLANILVYPTLFLAATPFFIDQLSETVFGEWMLINSYVFIAAHLIGFGLPDSITAHIAQALGTGNQQKLYAYINASGRLLGRMTILTSIFGLLLIGLLYAGIVLFSMEIWQTVIIATFIISLRFQEILLHSIFKGFERYDLFAIFNMAGKILSLGVQIILVAYGYSLVELFIGNLIVLLCILVVQAFVVKKKIPQYHPDFIKSVPERKEIYHFGFWSWLQTVISIGAFQMDRFIVGYFLGTATVTYYVLASTIANHLHMAFVAAVSWLLPKISRLKARTLDTKDYFYTIRAFSVGFSLLTISVLFTLWLGPIKYIKINSFFELFMIFEVFLILSIVPNQYLNAIKSLSFSTALELMYKLGIIVSMILFFIYFQTAESLIWGQIAALVLFMPVEYFLINKRILKSNSFKESLGTLLPSVFISVSILSENWIWSSVFFSLACLCFYFVYAKDKHINRSLLTE